MLNFITAQDKYGHPIKLNYKGKATYQTFVGGLISIVFKVIIYAFI